MTSSACLQWPCGHALHVWQSLCVHWATHGTPRSLMCHMHAFHCPIISNIPSPKPLDHSPVGLQGLVRTTRRGGLGPASSAASQSRSGWPLHSGHSRGEPSAAGGRARAGDMARCKAQFGSLARCSHDKRLFMPAPAGLARAKGNVVAAAAHLDGHEVVEVVRPEGRGNGQAVVHGLQAAQAGQQKGQHPTGM